MAELYRKSSLDKLSNPEQLDKAIVITSPMSWIALIGVALIIVVVGVWSVKGKLPTVMAASGLISDSQGVCAIYAKDSGIVTSLYKNAGDYINKGDVILVLRKADGIQITIEAEEEGELTEYLVAEESPVYSGMEVARITPDTQKEQLVVCYVPIAGAKQLKTGMEVLVYPTSVDSQKYGHMKANIKSISEYAVNTANMWYVTGTGNMVAEQFIANGPVAAVVCELQADNDSVSGFYWSSDTGRDLTVSNGTYVTAKIVTEECAPITKLFNYIKDKLED